MTITKEKRAIQADYQLKNDGSGKDHIVGYALKFDKRSSVLGGFQKFTEVISRNALDNADLSNVVATFNHDQSKVLARNTLTEGPGSLKLDIDNIGLKFDFIPTDTTYARDLVENMRSGLISQCSFMFSLPDDKDADEVIYDRNSDIAQRTIKRIDRLYDVSVVTTPAYPDTNAEISQRSLGKIELLKKMPNEKRKILMDLDLLQL